MSEKDDALNGLNEAIDEINAFYDELGKESNRAAAILAVASLEDEIERVILSKFPTDMTRQIWKQLAGPSAPLGSFKARTDFAQAFGFFGTATNNTLKTIAEIRNKFAHRTNIRTFDHPVVREKIIKLSQNAIHPFACVETSSNEILRRHFLETVEVIENRLSKIREYIPELCGLPPDRLP